LSDLEKRCHYHSTTNVKGDSHESAYMEGQRSVFYLLNQCYENEKENKMSNEQITQETVPVETTTTETTTQPTKQKLLQQHCTTTSSWKDSISEDLETILTLKSLQR